jgi:putative phosphoesterase
MRIAFLSDIHANLVAFEAVLADLEASKPEKIIFLGDAATLGPNPRGVMERLRAINCPCIMGNHDAFVLDRATAPDLDWVSDWYARQLTAGDLDYLRTFLPTLTIPLDEHTSLLCYHGSPQSNTDQILPTTPGEKLEAMLGSQPAEYYIGGHTHIQMMKQYNGRIIINPGSVGMPFEHVPFPETGPRFLPYAEYGTLHFESGHFGIELRRVPLDLPRLRQSYFSSRMPDAMYWWGLWLPR